MTLRDLAERWVAIKNMARPSPNTASARVSDLWAIGQSLAGLEHADPDKLGVLADLSPGDVTLSRLEDAFAAYSSGHASSSTRRVMSTWRQFCLWMVRDGHLAANPMDHIEAPARTTWSPKPLQPEDLAAVAEHASSPAVTSRNPWPERDEALFALLIAAGLRISEVAGLQIGDCYLQDDPPRLRITGKGDKVRTVPIPPEAVARLDAYLESRSVKEFDVDATSPCWCVLMVGR